MGSHLYAQTLHLEEGRLCALCKEVFFTLRHIDSRGNTTLPALPALPSGTGGK